MNSLNNLCRGKGYSYCNVSLQKLFTKRIENIHLYLNNTKTDKRSHK